MTGFADVKFCKMLAKTRKISKNHRYWWLRSSGKWYLCFRRKTINGYVAIAGGYFHGFKYEEKVPAFKIQEHVK